MVGDMKTTVALRLSVFLIMVTLGYSTVAHAAEAPASRPATTRPSTGPASRPSNGNGHSDLDDWLIQPPTRVKSGVELVDDLHKKRDGAGLKKLIASDDTNVAMRAVTALADVDGVDSISAAFADKRVQVRYMAVSVLGNSKDPAQLDKLAKFLKDDAPSVRIAAVRGISQFPNFASFDYLFDALDDSDAGVRRSALGAIEDRVGLRFPVFKVDDPIEKRKAASAQMRARVNKMVPHSDRSDKGEKLHENSNKK